MDSLFPEREEGLKGETEKIRAPIETEKRKLFSIGNEKIVFVAEKLLPKVF